jgi:hypothetical protein
VPQTPRSYATQSQGYRFRLDADNAAVLRTIPDFEGREEPAGAEDFLRERAETWADALAAAGAEPAEYDVRLNAHQRRAELVRTGTVVFAAEI